MTCLKNKDKQKAIRDTWIKKIPPNVQYYFFMGNDGPDRIEEDVIYLNCLDDYKSLPVKQFKCLTFLLDKFPDLDFTFNCDDDTYVVPERLVGCNPTDYMGYPTIAWDRNYRYAYGGAGFFLSNTAIKNLLLFKDMDIINSYPWADSLIGLLMHMTKVPFTEDYRFNMGKYNNGLKQICQSGQTIGDGQGTPVALPTKENNLITSHFIDIETFYKIYDHFYGEGIIQNKYLIKSEYTSIHYTIFEKHGEWYYHRGCGRTAFTKDIGSFGFPEFAERAALEEDQDLYKKIRGKNET